MPDSLARLRVQGKKAICKEIVADAIGAVEIKRGGACWNVDNSAPGIERHPGPIVRGAAGLPRILWPSVVAEFTGMRDGVKRPTQLTGSNVIGANVAGRCRESLGIAAAKYHQVPVNDTRAGQIYRLRAGRFAAKIFAEVDSADVSKGGNRIASRGVQRVYKVHHTDQNALVSPISPISEPAIRLRSTYSRVEPPQKPARRGIQRENFLCWRDSVEHAFNDDRARLQTAFLLSIEAPSDGQVLYVAAIDLCQLGIMIVLRGAAVRRPVLLRLAGLSRRVCRAGDQTGGGDDQGRNQNCCANREYFHNALLFHGSTRRKDSTPAMPGNAQEGSGLEMSASPDSMWLCPVRCKGKARLRSYVAPAFQMQRRQGQLL